MKILILLVVEELLSVPQGSLSSESLWVKAWSLWGELYLRVCLCEGTIWLGAIGWEVLVLLVLDLRVELTRKMGYIEDPAYLILIVDLPTVD